MKGWGGEGWGGRGTWWAGVLTQCWCSWCREWGAPATWSPGSQQRGEAWPDRRTYDSCPSRLRPGIRAPSPSSLRPRCPGPQALVPQTRNLDLQALLPQTRNPGPLTLLPQTQGSGPPAPPPSHLVHFPTPNSSGLRTCSSLVYVYSIFLPLPRDPVSLSSSLSPSQGPRSPDSELLVPWN